MHNVLAALLIILTGWTLSSHAMVLTGQNLHGLLLTAPFAIAAVAGMYHALVRMPSNESTAAVSWPPWLIATGSERTDIRLGISLFVVPFLLYVSWGAFWAASVAILTYCLGRCGRTNFRPEREAQAPESWHLAVVFGSAVAASVLTLAVTRSDLDDAFYVAVAAFSAANPGAPLLAFDPMHGDANLPLIFPSYRFASFELLAGALAHLLGIPAMDVMYRIFPPLWAIATVFCIFLLARTYMPERWLSIGLVTLVLIVVLGESHRAPANMMFVRMFQGKAAYLSVIVPAIFYLTARYCSKRGTAADLFLLGCSQVAAIGLSNFGMLAAPIAGFGALTSNLPCIAKSSGWKLWGILATLAIPIPYLGAVAIESGWGLPMTQFHAESAPHVWMSVFGANQQYLVAVLLLSGPVLARDAITRWRLSVPPFLLFVIYLNPFLSHIISNYITTAPVYWRLAWSFPIVIFSAISVSIIVDRLTDPNEMKILRTAFPATVFVLFIAAVPFHSLRPANIGPQQGLASLKIDIDDYEVAKRTIELNGLRHRVLAPDRIAGVISRFEEHPKLVSVRGMYLDILAPALGPTAYRQRRALHDFVSSAKEFDAELVSSALKSFAVSTVVMSEVVETKGAVELLVTEDFRVVMSMDGFSIWQKDL